MLKQIIKLQDTSVSKQVGSRLSRKEREIKLFGIILNA